MNRTMKKHSLSSPSSTLSPSANSRGLNEKRYRGGDERVTKESLVPSSWGSPMSGVKDEAVDGRGLAACGASFGRIPCDPPVAC